MGQYDYLYNTAHWKKLRLWKLRHDPLCKLCLARGRAVQASIVDHIKQHKGSLELFNDVENLQSLCVSCHNAIKQQQERSGYSKASDVNGYPTDINHPWNRKKSERG